MLLDRLFISVLNMSFVAIYVIIFVIIARLLLKKAPKIFSYALWGVVLLRLLCPFSFESNIGLLPSNTQPIPQDIVYQAIPEINTGINMIDSSINKVLPPVVHPDASINPIQIKIFIYGHIWLIGIAIMAIYSLVQLIKLRKKLIGAIPLKDNIYLADHISSPFVMGLIRPKIYLPSNLSESEQDYIIAHENHHIKRFDHITRILAFIALSVHWFNPFVWFAFILSGKDMELSCDEAVLKKMDKDIRAEYSSSLLRFATGRKLMTATPLAFGEGDTKGRVKNVMKYKKPVIWVSAICFILVSVVAVSLMSNSKNDEQDLSLLNPEMLPSVAHQIEGYVIVIAEDETKAEVFPKKIANFLDGDFERKNMDALELIASYQFDIGGTTVSLYETEPNLIKFHNEHDYRYYTKSNVYNDFVAVFVNNIQGEPYQFREIDTIQVVLAGGNPAYGSKSKMITDKSEISAFVDAFNNFTVNEDVALDIDIVPPSYYRLYDGDELIDEFMFNGNDTTAMWIGQYVKFVEYVDKNPFELYENSKVDTIISYQDPNFDKAVATAKEYVKDDEHSKIIDYNQPKVEKIDALDNFKIFSTEGEIIEISGTVYTITFETEDDEMLGSIIAYINAETYEMYGIGARR